MKLMILRILCVLLIVAAVGLYVYGVVVNGDSPTEHLLRSLVIGLSGVSVLMKLTPKHRPLKEYAAAYAQHLGSAFQQDPEKREKLLEAIRLFDEQKCPAAMKALDALRPDAVTRDEKYAVGLFTALCQAQQGLNEAAITTYEDMAADGLGNSRLYSNLAARYLEVNHLESAAEAARKAVALDENNARAYNNLGSILLKMADYPQAEQAAERACTLDPTLYEGWTLLAIVQAAQGKDSREAVRQAVRNGQNEQALNGAMAHYRQRNT